MERRTASCSCGQLDLICVGEPLRVSICHCPECQKLTGSIFATQARFPRAAVTIEGISVPWPRRGDEGGEATFHFCPTCGSTVYWTAPDGADGIAVAVGAFADPAFPPPRVAVYEARQHRWVPTIGALAMERFA